MKSLILLISVFVFLSCNVKKTAVKPEEKITVAAYYFPNYHTGDPRNDSNKGKD